MTGHSSDTPRSSDTPDNFGVECNPTGPWAMLRDERVKMAILDSSRRGHALCAQESPALGEWKIFLDVFTSEWFKLKAKVEETSAKYGFRPCLNLSDVSPGDRAKLALLALTLKGSFLLFGNGCLTSSGASGQYEKIPLRKADGGTTTRVPHGEQCASQPAVGQPLYLHGPLGIAHTSPIYSLYYTIDSLPRDDVRQLQKELSQHFRVFSDTVSGLGASMPTTQESYKEAPREKETVPLEI